ncbi:hypothetical protein GCM10010517_44280 [Streptosporangium fragile]|uniref:Uncharacterized protein n=1 Tax=Streptosporangium fragile TaxID=46186 RepID=A0ABN3W0E8_9ACTN
MGSPIQLSSVRLTDRVADSRVVRWEEAMAAVPVGHVRAVTAYRSAMTAADPIVLAGDYLGFPRTDSAAFNGRQATDAYVRAGSDRYNATASALNSGGYDFIATWNSLSPDFHHPVFKVSTPRGQGPPAARPAPCPATKEPKTYLLIARPSERA